MNGDEGKRLFSWQKTIVNIALINGQKTIHTLLMHWNVIFQTFKHVLKNAIWPCYWNISLQGYKMRKRSFFGRLRRKMIIFAGVRFPKEDVSRHINKVRIFGGKWPFRRLKHRFQFFSLRQHFFISTQSYQKYISCLNVRMPAPK